jgi:alpha-ketoglutarate-dependent taurine dioxygenase
MIASPVTDSARPSPFDLADAPTYARWRAWKLADYPDSAEALRVAVADPAAPSPAETAALMRVLAKTNMAVYAAPPETGRDGVRALGRHFGLERLDHNLGADGDGLTAIRVVAEGSRTRYIPYTDRPISWHTDGYYNEPHQWIRGMVLHCVRPGRTGGENALMDPDVAYIRLRDADPAFIEALQHPEAMTIPANEDANGAVRAEQTGPVFSLNLDGSLHMRYTARTRNIRWRDDPATLDAVAFLNDLLAGDDACIIRYRLSPGEGLLCNNVLHNRTAFSDGEGAGEGTSTRGGRLIYRGRYLDRIAGTGLYDVWPDANES